MKLSTLEALVAAMRERADYYGVTDPNVELYYANNERFRNELKAEHYPFVNFEVDPDCTRDTLKAHTVHADGSAAKKGDYAIPLSIC